MPRFALQCFVIQRFIAQYHPMPLHATLCRALLRHAVPCSALHRVLSRDHCLARHPTVRIER
eukprot:4465963-Pyramimonas_sp.AAC.1